MESDGATPSQKKLWSFLGMVLYYQHFIEQRWVVKLAAYDFNLKYVPGNKNTVADVLSREPFQWCF